MWIKEADSANFSGAVSVWNNLQAVNTQRGEIHAEHSLHALSTSTHWPEGMIGHSLWIWGWGLAMALTHIRSGLHMLPLPSSVLCVFVCVLMLETKVFHITSTLSPKCKVLLSERTALSFKTNNKRKRSRQYFPSSCMEAFLYQASFNCLFLSHAPESAFQCLKTGPFILRAGLKLAHCHGYKI